MSTLSKKKLLLLDFIETYRSLPELWDRQCTAYSNKAKKAAAYNKLIEKLEPIEGDATRESVVRKVNNIRSTFRKELKKVSDSKMYGASNEEIYTPSLWYFDELLFLVGHESSDPSSMLLEEGGGYLVSQPVTPPSITCATPAKRIKTKQNCGDSAQLLVNAPKYLEAGEDDECVTLAKGYANKLRKLTEQQLMFADKIINDTLFDAQMGVLTRRSHIVHPPSDVPQQPPK